MRAPVRVGRVVEWSIEKAGNLCRGDSEQLIRVRQREDAIGNQRRHNELRETQKQLKVKMKLISAIFRDFLILKIESKSKVCQ